MWSVADPYSNPCSLYLKTSGNPLSGKENFRCFSYLWTGTDPQKQIYLIKLCAQAREKTFRWFMGKFRKSNIGHTTHFVNGTARRILDVMQRQQRRSALVVSRSNEIRWNVRLYVNYSVSFTRIRKSSNSTWEGAVGWFLSSKSELLRFSGESSSQLLGTVIINTCECLRVAENNKTVDDWRLHVFPLGI